MRTLTIVLLTAIIFMIGCSKEARLSKKAERFLKNQLYDPKSYERLSFELPKAQTQVEYYKDSLRREVKNWEENLQMVRNSKNIEESLYGKQEIKLITDKLNKLYADTIKFNELIDENKIYRIVFDAKYRTRHKSGVLVTQSARIEYEPTSGFIFKPNRKTGKIGDATDPYSIIKEAYLYNSVVNPHVTDTLTQGDQVTILDDSGSMFLVYSEEKDAKGYIFFFSVVNIRNE